MTKSRRPVRAPADPAGAPGEGLLRRLPAGLLDAALVLAIMAGLAVLAARAGPLRPVVGILAGLMPLVYFVAFEGAWLTTPGKRLLGIWVVKADGSRPDLLEHLLRGMTRLPEALFVLPYVAVIAVSQRNQRLGDMVTDCLVTRERPSS